MNLHWSKAARPHFDMSARTDDPQQLPASTSQGLEKLVLAAKLRVAWLAANGMLWQGVRTFEGTSPTPLPRIRKLCASKHPL